MKGIARVYDLGNGPYFKSFEQFCAQVGSQVTPVKHPILHDGAEGAVVGGCDRKIAAVGTSRDIDAVVQGIPVLNTCLK